MVGCPSLPLAVPAVPAVPAASEGATAGGGGAGGNEDGRGRHGWTTLPVGDSLRAATSRLWAYTAADGDGGGITERVPAFRVCPRNAHDVAINDLLHWAAHCGFVSPEAAALLLKSAAGGAATDDAAVAPAAAATPMDPATTAATTAFTPNGGATTPTPTPTPLAIATVDGGDIVALRLPSSLIAYLRSTCASEVRRGQLYFLADMVRGEAPAGDDAWAADEADADTWLMEPAFRDQLRAIKAAGGCRACEREGRWGGHASASAAAAAVAAAAATAAVVEATGAESVTSEDEVGTTGGGGDGGGSGGGGGGGSGGGSGGGGSGGRRPKAQGGGRGGRCRHGRRRQSLLVCESSVRLDEVLLQTNVTGSWSLTVDGLVVRSGKRGEGDSGGDYTQMRGPN